jgi:hypothetical protein
MTIHPKPLADHWKNYFRVNLYRIAMVLSGWQDGLVGSVVYHGAGVLSDVGDSGLSRGFVSSSSLF